MFEYYEKRRIKRLIYSKPALGLLAVLLLFLGSATWDAYSKEQEAAARKDISVREKNELITRKEALEEELVRLSTERGVEEEIRGKFDVAREGEKIIVLVDAKELGADVGESTNSGFFGKILGFFGW